MLLRLIEPSIKIEQAYIDYISEWEKTGERIVPQSSRREGLNYFDLITKWKEESTEKAYNKGLVPASLYFLADESERIYGALQIRHGLNEYLFNYGGHIGYGIRPSERQKGYATKMLALSLPFAKSLGIDKVLITCFKSNCASAKTIINNGGILENEVIEDGKIKQRYWINL